MSAIAAVRRPYFAGAKAYCDFLRSPLIPCVVLSVDDDTVTVRLTATRGPWKRGEILRERKGSGTVVPRDCVRVRNGCYLISETYRWA